MKVGIKRWSAEEDSMLRQEACACSSVAEVAGKLGRTESAVRGRAYVLRVVLPSAWRQGSVAGEAMRPRKLK